MVLIEKDPLHDQYCGEESRTIAMENVNIADHLQGFLRTVSSLPMSLSMISWKYVSNTDRIYIQLSWASHSMDMSSQTAMTFRAARGSETFVRPPSLCHNVLLLESERSSNLTGPFAMQTSIHTGTVQGTQKSCFVKGLDLADMNAWLVNDDRGYDIGGWLFLCHNTGITIN